jgi:hypothetical protein
MKLAILSLAAFYLLTSPLLFPFYSSLSFELNTTIWLLIHFLFFVPFIYGGVKILRNSVNLLSEKA